MYHFHGYKQFIVNQYDFHELLTIITPTFSLIM